MESTINQFRSHDRGVDGAKNQLGRRAALRRAVPTTHTSLPVQLPFHSTLCPTDSNTLIILLVFIAKLYKADKFRGGPLPL